MSALTVHTLAVQFAWLLLGAALIGILGSLLDLPYAVALVLSGLLIAQSHLTAVPTIAPDIVLFAFLPPLLFEAAFRLDVRRLRRMAWPVLLFAVPGTIATAVLVGGGLTLFVGLPLGVGLLFGCIVSATDPVAVVAIVKQLGLPERIAVVPEAESLLNDGVAITLYTAVLDFTVTGRADPLSMGRIFGVAVIGGLGIGAILALAASRLTRLVDDPLIEMTLSAALAYGSFLIADAIQASGALACVAAGLIYGTYGRRVGMSAETSQRLDDLWGFQGYVANAVLFLLIGFSVDLAALWTHPEAVVAAIVAVLVARYPRRRRRPSGDGPAWPLGVASGARRPHLGRDPGRADHRPRPRPAAGDPLARSAARDDVRRGALHPGRAGPDPLAHDPHAAPDASPPLGRSCQLPGAFGPSQPSDFRSARSCPSPNRPRLGPDGSHKRGACQEYRRRQGTWRRAIATQGPRSRAPAQGSG